jgi:hypothetical protein
MEAMRKHNNFAINVIHIFVKKMQMTGEIAMLREEEG